MSCASCRSEVPAGARFCPTCGTSQIGADEERRVVTVAFADIVGFTALAEQLDPEHVKRLVDRLFVQLTRDITSFGGVVDKIVGDEIVALFGAPVAHEDDAERAVRAALRMQETLAAMAVEAETVFRMRIGINTGEVLVGSSASGRDYTAMGDVMNTASRLQTMAEPGQIVVGGSTYSATSEAIEYRSLGLLQPRGRLSGVEAFLAISATRPPGTRTRRTSVFVGRDHELDLLGAQARLAFDLRQAQVAVLYGDAGMGKARVAEELTSRLVRSDGALVLRGHCVPYGEANVWWPISEALRPLFCIGIDATLEEAGAAIKTSFARANVNAGGDVDRYTLAMLHALGYPTPLRTGNRDRNRSEVTLAFTTLLEAELAIRPVVLLLSDMHWATDAVWALVQHVLVQLNRSRFVVLLSARRTGDRRLTEGRFGTLTIELGPLERSAARQLVAELDVTLSSVDTDELIERSGGNPFFLEELASLVGSQRAHADALGPPDAGSRLGQIPDTLRGLLAARLDQLEPDARRALEAAAVIGRSGPVASIHLMLEDQGWEGDAAQGVSALVESDIISIDGSRFTFVSDLTREVAYGTITKMARARTHERIARFLEETNGPSYRNSTAVAIARHYHAAAELNVELELGDPADRSEIVAKAVHWLSDAAERAMAGGVPAEAEDWFGSALELAPLTLHPALLYGRAKARGEQRKVAATRADLDHLDALDFDDPSLRAKALVVRGDIDAKAGDYHRSVQVLTEAIKQLHGLGDAAEEASALRRLGVTDMLLSDDAAAKSSLELARRVAAEAGERGEEAWALQSLAWFAYRAGRIEEASAFVDEATKIFSELDDRSGLAWTMGIGAWVAFHRGDWNVAKALVADVLPETRRRGDPWAEAIMMILHASMSLWSGQAREALDIAREAQGVAERADDFSLAVQARALEGRALISRGRVAEGLAALEQSAALADRGGDDETRRIAMVSNCAASARLGDAERALRWAARFDGLGDGALVGEAELSIALATALLQRGAVDDAETQLQWVFEPTADGSAVSSGTFAAAVGAMIASAQGRLELADRRIEASLSGQPTYLDRMLALLARATVCRRRDDIDGSRHAIEAARALLADTDDRISPLLVTLVEAIVEDGDLMFISAEISALGIDPTGWIRSWTLAAAGVDVGA